MSLAVFIADQRTSHRVPHTVACRALGVSQSWFYKWQHRPRRPTPTEQRRAELDAAVAEAFKAPHPASAPISVPRRHLLPARDHAVVLRPQDEAIASSWDKLWTIDLLGRSNCCCCATTLWGAQLVR